MDVPPIAKWISKSLFYSGTFSIFGPFLPFLIKNRIFKKGHFREIHQIFDFDTRVSNDSVRRWAIVQGRYQSASFPYIHF
jgi:hypothetical protein